MHMEPTVKSWMHHVHDDAVRVAHYTNHMFHEKSFWGIVAIIALLAGLFTLIAFSGNETFLDYQSVPMPHGGYY